MLTIGRSGHGKIKPLLNLINQKLYTDKAYLYVLRIHMKQNITF